MRFTLLFLIFLADKVLIDRVILVVENSVYTLFDLKKHCILTSIVEDEKDWKSCNYEENLKLIFPDFLYRAVLLETIGKGSQKVNVDGIKEILEKAKEAGLKEEDVVRWFEENIKIKEYVESGFKGKMDVLTDHLETLKKGMKIKVFF